MKIVTWNVNSIRARLPNVLEWLDENKPEIVLFQETKVVEEQFPYSPFEERGYNLAVLGQKSYNGVAIASKFALEDVKKGIPDYQDDQARYIEAITHNVHVASLYVPNGQEVGSEKFDYKLSFLKHLTSYVQKSILAPSDSFIMGGDYNIAPSSEDVFDPIAWNERILCSTPERKALRKLFNLGLTDALRVIHPVSQTPHIFTWWDYRAGSFHKNKGLRIDHLLLSPFATDRLKDASVDTEPRGKEKASDHIPVWCTLNTETESCF